MRKLDARFDIEEDEIVEIATGEVVPVNEPVALFRARDPLALWVLRNYRLQALNEGAAAGELADIDAAIEDFTKFAELYSAEALEG